jgi:predicted transcriptional regulator
LGIDLRRHHLFAFSLAVLLSFAFLAVIYSREETNDTYLASPIVLSSSSIANTEFSGFFNQSTRIQIYNLIQNNPGIYFREICDCLGLSIGTVQYHLDLLMKRGFVTAKQDGRYKRYFEAEKYAEPEMRMISFLKHSTTRHILIALQADVCTHKELTDLLGISSQALTWQMNRLRKTGFIYAISYNLTIKYFLTSEANNLVKIACLQLKGS